MATAKKAPAKKSAVKKAPAKKTAAKSVAKAAKIPAKKPTPRGRAQDRRLVAGKQKHEVAYEAKKEGVSKGMVAEVIKAVGNSRQKVEATIQSFLKERKPPKKATPKKK